MLIRLIALSGDRYTDCIARMRFTEHWIFLKKQAGVKAWWYSVSAKGSYPLFKSKYLPYRKDADTEFYHWLVDETHKRGIAILSWEYLNTAPLLTRQHPEWRYKYFGTGAATERVSHFVCYNSPYGELLKRYCVEVIKELGFYGILAGT